MVQKISNLESYLRRIFSRVRSAISDEYNKKPIKMAGTLAFFIFAPIILYQNGINTYINFFVSVVFFIIFILFNIFSDDRSNISILKSNNKNLTYTIGSLSSKNNIRGLIVIFLEIKKSVFNQNGIIDSSSFIRCDRLYREILDHFSHEGFPHLLSGDESYSHVTNSSMFDNQTAVLNAMEKALFDLNRKLGSAEWKKDFSNASASL